MCRLLLVDIVMFGRLLLYVVVFVCLLLLCINVWSACYDACCCSLVVVSFCCLM